VIVFDDFYNVYSFDVFGLLFEFVVSFNVGLILVIMLWEELDMFFGCL